MNEKIAHILDQLEKRSQQEKSREADTIPDERMLAITKETGELINMILNVKNAKNVLEIGMSTGYSTIWSAEAIMQNNGKIWTIEKNPKKIQMALKNFEDAGITKMVEILEGDALECLEKICKDKKFHNFFDFVLIDADKENVIKYFEHVFPLVKINGVIMTDNMLYPEKFQEGMKKFSDYLRTNDKVKTITSPIGNGEEITLKIKN